MITSNEIREIMNDKVLEFNREYGYNIPIVDFPIEIDNRLSKTRAYFRFRKYTYDPMMFKFSKNVLIYDTDENIYNTILHELAHYITMEVYQDNLGHSNEWKEICSKIGLENATRLFTEDKELAKSTKRYHMYCNDCGEFVSVLSRLTDKRRIDTINGRYTHTKCFGKIYIVDTKTNETIGKKEKKKVK